MTRTRPRRSRKAPGSPPPSRPRGLISALLYLFNQSRRQRAASGTPSASPLSSALREPTLTPQAIAQRLLSEPAEWLARLRYAALARMVVKRDPALAHWFDRQWSIALELMGKIPARDLPAATAWVQALETFSPPKKLTGYAPRKHPWNAVTLVLTSERFSRSLRQHWARSRFLGANRTLYLNDLIPRLRKMGVPNDQIPTETQVERWARESRSAQIFAYKLVAHLYDMKWTYCRRVISTERAQLSRSPIWKRLLESAR